MASHRCEPGSISVLAVSRELGLFLVLVLFRGFFSGVSGLSTSTKTNTSKFQFDLEEGGRFVSIHTVTCFPE